MFTCASCPLFCSRIQRWMVHFCCILHNLFFYSLGKWPTFSRRENKFKTTKEFIDVLKKQHKDSVKSKGSKEFRIRKSRHWALRNLVIRIIWVPKYPQTHSDLEWITCDEWKIGNEHSLPEIWLITSKTELRNIWMPIGFESDKELS